jgi:hypothetical protein
MVRSQITWSSVDFFNENEFEEVLKKNEVLKDYLVFDAKKTLNKFRNYTRYADLLLIEKTYKYWVIGDVEISRHSFKNHIFPQLIEIYSLIEQNLDLIRKNFLDIPGIEKTKEIEDLINFNKPFLSLIIDKIPSNYLNILPILNTFCNVNTVIRLKDSEENYVYINDDFYMSDIIDRYSVCYIKERILFIDFPNLLGLNNNTFEYIEFKNERYTFEQNVSVVQGSLTLFFILNENIPNGKYKISTKQNHLILLK